MRLILSILTLFAVAACQYVTPRTRNMPGPDAAGAQQPFEDPGIRPPARPLNPR